jgi:protein gp37
VTTQATLTRVDQLFDVGDESTLRFVSVEPQWEEIGFGERLKRLDWIIQGGTSGTAKYPFNLAWADSLQEACRKARLPYFLKQLGTHVVAGDERLKFRDSHGADWSEWPERLGIRQMPIYCGRKPSSKLRRRNGETGAASLYLPAAPTVCGPGLLDLE